MLKKVKPRTSGKNFFLDKLENNRYLLEPRIGSLLAVINLIVISHNQKSNLAETIGVQKQTGWQKTVCNFNMTYLFKKLSRNNSKIETNWYKKG